MLLISSRGEVSLTGADEMMYIIFKRDDAISRTAQAADATTNCPSSLTAISKPRDGRGDHRNSYARPSPYARRVLPALPQQGGAVRCGFRAGSEAAGTLRGLCGQARSERRGAEDSHRILPEP